MPSRELHEASMNKAPEQLWRLVIYLFFVSGLCGLVYQVLWMHTLVLVFGGTTLATSTVIAVFMGGLALGSFLAARFADRVSNPFSCYGWLEGAIGIWAIFTPWMFELATHFYRFAFQYCTDLVAWNLVRFAVVCIILLPPTTCMGATLPLLSRLVTERLESVGGRIGLLYSINTVGAVVGTVLAGFVLVPTLGLTATIAVTAAINLALALTVFIVQKRTPVESFMSAPQAESSTTNTAGLNRSTMMIISLFIIAGGVSMVYEVAWTRALLLVIGSSTYAFTVMLTAFLLGIVVGSFVCSRFIDRLPDAVACLAFLELLAGLTAFVGLTLFGILPYWNLLMGAHWYQYPLATVAIRFLLAVTILMPLTCCIGATFPAMVKACTKQLEQVGRSVGTIYSANTLGAIVGACLTGFFLVPALGSERTLVLAALASIMIGVAMLFLVPSVRVPVKVLAGGAAVLLMFGFRTIPPFWDPLVLLMSQFERRELMVGHDFNRASYADWADSLRNAFKLLFYRDGTTSSAAVVLRKSTGQILLLTNGHIDASSSVDMSVQELLSYIPLWCCASAKQAAIVGWGSGVSVGAAAKFPLQHIDVIELEPAVLQAARFFDRINHKPQDDPRISIIANDGRNYLLTTPNKYDVIVSEPSNPWQSGVCNLFTREYFGLCRQRLNEHGILSLWLQIAEVSPASIKQITSALAQEFPHTLTFQPDGGNLVVLASPSPIKVDAASIDRSLQDPNMSADFRRADIDSAEDALSLLLMTDQGLRALSKHMPPNTDDRNRVEYEVAKTYESHLYRDENNDMLHAQSVDLDTAVKWPNLSSQELSSRQARVAEMADARHNRQAAACWIAAAFRSGRSAEGYRVRGWLESQKDEWSKADSDWQEALRMDPNDSGVIRTRAHQYALHGDSEAAQNDYKRLLQIDPQDQGSRYALARLYAPPFLGCGNSRNRDDAQQILALISPLLEDRAFIKTQPNVLFLAADAYFRLDKFEQAQHACAAYLTINPIAFPAAHLMERIENSLRHKAEAAKWHAAVLDQIQHVDGLPKLTARAKQLIDRHKLPEARALLSALQEYVPGDQETLTLLNSVGRPEN